MPMRRARGKRARAFLTACLLALLGWSAAAGAVHGAWLWCRLRRFTRVEMPERIDGTIVLSLTFILWFCIPPLIILMRATGS